MILKKLVVTNLETNCYVCGCERTRLGVVIDPGGNARDILDAVREARLDVQYVINTHGHIDHVGANAPVLEATGAKLAVHELDAPMLVDLELNLGAYLGYMEAGPPADLLLRNGDTLEVGEIVFEVLHTPGHTPGGISLYVAQEGVVFTGDALFKMSIGRTDLPGGSHEQLVQSIREKLFALPGDTDIYAGHGPATTVAEEKRKNPWL